MCERVCVCARDPSKCITTTSHDIYVSSRRAHTRTSERARATIPLDCDLLGDISNLCACNHAGPYCLHRCLVAHKANLESWACESDRKVRGLWLIWRGREKERAGVFKLVARPTLSQSLRAPSHSPHFEFGSSDASGRNLRERECARACLE